MGRSEARFTASSRSGNSTGARVHPFTARSTMGLSEIPTTETSGVNPLRNPLVPTSRRVARLEGMRRRMDRSRTPSWSIVCFTFSFSSHSLRRTEGSTK